MQKRSCERLRQKLCQNCTIDVHYHDDRCHSSNNESRKDPCKPRLQRWQTWLGIPDLLPFSVTPTSSGIPSEGRFRYWFRQKLVPVFRFARHAKTEPVPVVGQDSGPFRSLPTVDLYPIQPGRNHAVTLATISATRLRPFYLHAGGSRVHRLPACIYGFSGGNKKLKFLLPSQRTETLHA